MKKNYQTPGICLICVDATLLTALDSQNADCTPLTKNWNDNLTGNDHIFY